MFLRNRLCELPARGWGSGGGTACAHAHPGWRRGREARSPSCSPRSLLREGDLWEAPIEHNRGPGRKGRVNTAPAGLARYPLSATLCACFRVRLLPCEVPTCCPVALNQAASMVPVAEKACRPEADGESEPSRLHTWLQSEAEAAAQLVRYQHAAIQVLKGSATCGMWPTEQRAQSVPPSL